MDLSRIQVVPRLRTGWEAIDLGFTLAREWYKPLFLAWLIPSLVCFIAATGLCLLLDWPVIAASLLVWWFKPLWDSGLLLIGSRALFGEQVSTGQAIQGSWNFLKPECFSWLTWRRLSPFRSLLLVSYWTGTPFR